MAKPIEPTPELTGEDARRFIENMIKVQTSPPSEKDIQLAKELKRLSKVFNLDRLFRKGASYS
ncbi:MAG TPA: hypothetical protein VJB06_03020 [archaeon]|nr:hypothetical protein [archaeon]